MSSIMHAQIMTLAVININYNCYNIWKIHLTSFIIITFAREYRTCNLNCITSEIQFKKDKRRGFFFFTLTTIFFLKKSQTWIKTKRDKASTKIFVLQEYCISFILQWVELPDVLKENDHNLRLGFLLLTIHRKIYRRNLRKVV